MVTKRRTKIVATLGPASAPPEVLARLIEAGVDVFRLNFSHGAAEEMLERAASIRTIASNMQRTVGILADLQGPKIRIACFAKGQIYLHQGHPFVLDAALAVHAGSETAVGIDYPNLPQDVQADDVLLLDDGRIVLDVLAVNETQISCRVRVGGILSNHKGINRQGGGLSAAALTEKDYEDIAVAARMQADYLAVSFVRSAADIEQARTLLESHGGHAGIIAKIERAEALAHMDAMIEAADGIMVARGDLGVEVGDAALPPLQKSLIAKARRMNKIVVTATQMMDSMIHNPIPTRAEVFDVANAVLDGTDAVMLSAETAVGDYPVEVIQAVDRICLTAEQQREIRVSRHRMDSTFERMDEAIAMAAMYTANHMGVSVIAALTESGSTPLWMSRLSSGIPIFALTANVQTQRRVTLYRGVYPLQFEMDHADSAALNWTIVELLKREGMVGDAHVVIITYGDMHQRGCTNALKIIRVGDIRPSDGPESSDRAVGG